MSCVEGSVAFSVLGGSAERTMGLVRAPGYAIGTGLGELCVEKPEKLLTELIRGLLRTIDRVAFPCRQGGGSRTGSPQTLYLIGLFCPGPLRVLVS